MYNCLLRLPLSGHSIMSMMSSGGCSGCGGCGGCGGECVGGIL